MCMLSKSMIRTVPAVGASAGTLSRANDDLYRDSKVSVTYNVHPSCYSSFPLLQGLINDGILRRQDMK